MCISRFWLHGMVLLSEMELSAMRILFVIVLIQQQKARNVESNGVHCLHLKLTSVFEYKVDMARTGKKVGRPAKKDLAGVRRQAKAPKVKRNRYLIRTKLKAVELHESGMRLKAIRQWFIDNEGIYIIKSTLCTWLKAESIRNLNKIKSKK